MRICNRSPPGWNYRHDESPYRAGWLGIPGQSDAWWRFPCSIPADQSRAYYPDGLNYNNPYYYLRPEVVNDPSWAGDDEQWLPVFEPNVGCRILGLGMHEWDDAFAINDGPWLPTGLAAYWDLSWSVVLMCLGAAVSFYTGTEFSQRLTGVLASMFANVAAAAFLNWLNQRGAQAILDRAWWRTFEGTRGWGSLAPAGGPPLLWVPP